MKNEQLAKHSNRRNLKILRAVRYFFNVRLLILFSIPRDNLEAKLPVCES